MPASDPAQANTAMTVSAGVTTPLSPASASCIDLLVLLFLQLAFQLDEPHGARKRNQSNYPAAVGHQ